MADVVKNYSIHDIISFKIIDKNNFFKKKFSRFETSYSYFQVNKLSNPDIIINIGPFQPSNNNCKVLDGRFHIKKDYLFCNDSYKLAKWKLEIIGLESKKTIINVDANASGQLFIPGYIIDPIIRIKMQEKGYPMIHASAVSKNKNGYVFAARSGCGKTVISVSLLEKGFDFLGDNWIIIKNGYALNYISTLNIFDYNINDFVSDKMSSKDLYILKLKKILYDMTDGYIKLFSQIQIHRFISKINKRTKISKLFFITKNKKFSIKNKINKDNLITQLVLNNKFEMFPFFKYMLEYSFIFPNSKIASFLPDMEENIRRSLKNVKLYRMFIPENITPKTFKKIRESL
ncbi:MAG: hypothetical protein GTN36_02215 [Candidatus Aenigmarchaeota archaeon]|nr:hypothetical protein [Candidatus Aenigmarchaeota archaeon]